MINLFKFNRCLVFIFSTIFFVVLSFYYASMSIAQQSQGYAEAPTIFDNGVRKSTQFTVHFKVLVFDLAKGVQKAEISDIAPMHAKIKKFFENLEKKYGKISFVKYLPNAVWGDVWRKNRRTGKLVKIHDMSQLFTVHFTQFVPIDSIIAEIEAFDEVHYAHRPIEAVSFSDPNDPYYQNGTQWNLDIIQAAEAWGITKGSTEIVVGIIEDGMGESGIPDRNHQDFWTGSGSTGESKFVPDRGDYGNAGNHATSVAGVVGAATNDGDGVASLGWNIRMIPYRFATYEDQNYYYNLVDAISRAADSSHVINCSFGTRTLTGRRIGACIIYDSENYASVDSAIANAIAQGVVVVAGVGNTGIEFTNGAQECYEYLDLIIPYVPYPAAYPGVIGVSATDSNDVFAGGRAYNYERPIDDFIDVAAPGIDVLTMLPGNYYQDQSGTSFSSPHVGALAGLIRSVNNQLEPADVLSIIENTAEDIGEPENKVGSGRINAYEALKYTLENYGGTLRGEVVFTEDMNFTNGVTLTIEPGTTIKLDPGVDLWFRDNSKLIAVGTSSEPITFTSTQSNPQPSSYGTIYLFGSNNQLEYCTVEYADWGVKIHGYPSATTGNLVKNCTFRYNDQGLRIHNILRKTVRWA